MKCPKCGAQVESGSLYCPKCLQEIHWVAEYNTVETLMQKETKRRMQKEQKQRLEELKKKSGSLLRRRAFWKVFALGFFGLCVCIFWCADRSYLIQYSLAQRAYERGQYERALEYADKALTISPGKGKAAILLAQALQKQGDLPGAIKVLEGNLKGHADSLGYYEQLIGLYKEAGRPEKIKALLKDVRSLSIHEAFDHYLCADPEITPATGVYDEEMQAVIEEEKGVRYYYTLDGSKPTGKSIHYEGPISIGQGVTELYVVGENSHGVFSDVIYRKYTVIPDAPEEPDVMPDSGYYDKDEGITVDVPEGFKAYYAFDEHPTEDSAEYTSPVKMPLGEHTFYVILVGANGKVSDVASRNYYLYE
ncbi:MAG: tetratricopeptide repeat protein [Lachnospiraceae bacterium]|nr:tetratricopeptide repeat protein [Lachnospiraceae bacterium]